MQAIDLLGVHDAPGCSRQLVNAFGTGLWLFCQACSVAVQLDALHNSQKRRGELRAEALCSPAACKATRALAPGDRAGLTNA